MFLNQQELLNKDGDEENDEDPIDFNDLENDND
jgi:hypothetical protein